MTNEELFNFIKEGVEEHIKDHPELMSSPTMYDPDKLQDKMSFAIMQKNEQGYLTKKFFITVEYKR